MFNTTVNTTDFSILNQIAFWKSNRIYQLILNNEKLYGIYLERRLNGISKTVIIVDVITTIFSIFVSVVLLVVFPNLLPFNGFLGNLILFLLLIGSFEIFIRIPYFADKINKEEASRVQKGLTIIDESTNLIENQKDEEFLARNNKNFVLNVSEIEKSKTKFDEFLERLPERYGKLSLTLKDGSTKKFILVDYDYEKFESLFR